MFPIEYDLNIKNISNLLVATQLAMFYQRESSSKGNYHVFELGNVLANITQLKQNVTLHYSKEEFPVIKRIDYESNILKKSLYADFIDYSKDY